MEGDQHIVKRAKMADTRKKRKKHCSSLNSESSSGSGKKKRAKMADTRKFSLNSESPSETLAMDCAATPDDGQLYYDDNFEGILVKEFRSKLVKLPHPVEVEVEVLRWDVRRCTLTRVKGCFEALVAKELQFATSLIEKDANNFHAWSHRKWVLQTFGGVHTDKIWDEELVYCDKMVKKEPFNSLVWDHRYFVVTRCLVEYYEARASGEYERVQKADSFFWKKRDVEVDFAVKVIKGGEAGIVCPWSYLRSLYTVHSGLMASNASVTSVVLWVLDKQRNANLDRMEQRSSINALNMLIDLVSHGYRMQGRVGKKILKAVEALSDPDSPPNNTNQVLFDLETDLTASGLLWRNASSEFLAGDLRSFQHAIKFFSKIVLTKKAQLAPSLPAEKNIKKNDANASLPKLCKVCLHFPDMEGLHSH